jgi:hypothetical protein
MAKKRTGIPMETQQVLAGGRDTAMPMGSRPSKRSKTILSPSLPQAKAERSRQSSLRKQRDQIESTRKPETRRAAV